MATVNGIDVSSFQSLASINDAIHKGAKFGFVKATEGDHYVNPIHVEQAKAFSVHGLPVGFYHFLRHDIKAKDQWKHFQSVVWPYRHSCIIAVDDESDESGKFAPRQLVKDFVTNAHRNGFRIGRYASLATFELGSVGADWRWIAYWNPSPPPMKWRFWQTKGTGAIDQDLFNGDLKQLHSFWRNNTQGRSRI